MATKPGDNIDYSETNTGGAVDTLNDDPNVIKSNSKATGDKSTLNSTIPAASQPDHTINIDQPNDDDEGEGNTNHGSKGNAFKSEFEETKNEDTSQEDDDEEINTEEMTATVVLDAYCQIKMAIPSLIAVSDRKIKKLHRKGDIDMFMPVRENRFSPNAITVQQYLHNFNDKIVKPFETSDKFKEEVFPILKHVLKARNFTLTPEKALIAYLAGDLVKTVKAAAKAVGDRVDMINNIRDLCEEVKIKNANARPVTPDIPANNAQPAATSFPFSSAAGGQQQQQSDTAAPSSNTAKETVSNVVNDALKKTGPMRDANGKFMKKDTGSSQNQ